MCVGKINIVQCRLSKTICLHLLLQGTIYAMICTLALHLLNLPLFKITP
jgi:uncharacterized membrane protein YagU involved in acid resistance